MVDLNRLKDYMQKQAQEDKSRRIVQVSGASLQEALKEASIELSVPVRKLEYEVLQKGRRSVLGVGGREFLIIAYEGRVGDEQQQFDDPGFDLAGFGYDFQYDRDGEFYINFRPNGIFLKVTAPAEKGKRITDRMVLDTLAARGRYDLDTSLLSKVVKQAKNEYVRIGEFEYNPAHDSTLTVSVTEDEMKAFITALPPGPNGADLTPEIVTTFLSRNSVTYGILNDVLAQLQDRPVYNEPVLVAEGDKPVNGHDAKILYNFETDSSAVKLKEKDGRVDFKELNLVQNVVEGQVLAKKVDPEKGKAGKTITGKYLPAKDGKDIQIGIGKNVRLSDDGKAAISVINGQVVLAAGKVSVEPVYVVPGDVSLRTGNVLFLGTVVVKGSVTDGFSIKAAGNIEVMGNVGKCELDAEGDIIVHQGITGKSGGVVRCGHSLWAKFIENAHIEAGETIVVSDGIINSNVDANKKIICRGKRASIVGGKLRAAESVSAKTLGSVAGSETVIEVGYDPKSKEKFLTLDGKRGEYEKQLEDIKLNLNTLENVKKVRKALPEDKEAYYLELKQKQTDTLTEMRKVQKEMENIQNYLTSLKVMGKVSASGKVYPGVKIFIKDAPLEVRNEFRAVSFVLENETVKVTRYEEEEEEDALRG